jgi:transcriptional regulator with XRE-family HTH domain/Zn-dependent peptidase ImmA (M78 family)
MDKRLNIDNLTNAMEQAGLNSPALARELSVTRESVRKWLSGESFPRPDKLLRLGKAVGLAFGELVIKEDIHTPVVAFRKMRGTKTKDHHIENAQTMGRMLRHLVPYLPFDVLAMPPVLKEPSKKYDYLQQVTKMVRQEIHVGTVETIDFSHLIRHFSKLQAVVVPAMWGSKKVHENATHIYLPDSQTTWVYLNLDVNIHDFKFWMAHELGHCLAPELRGDEAEDFADAFAGTLLFPHELARKAYTMVSKLRGIKKKLEAIMQMADEHTISPWTIYKQTNFFATTEDLTPLQLEPEIHKWITRFNQRYLNVSATLFDGKMPPEASDFIDVTTDAFETPFFHVLGRYLKETHKGPGYVQTVMDIPLLDARGLHDALT